MQIPRWLNVLLVVIAINLAAVTLTSFWHLALAQELSAQEPEQPSDSELPSSRAEQSPPSPLSTDETNTQPAVDDNGTAEPPLPSTDPQSLPSSPGSQRVPSLEQVPETDPRLIPEIALPDDLPDLPQPEQADLENDPVFQEFQRMFSSTAESNGRSKIMTSNGREFHLLENRFGAVQSLTEAAQCIAREAHQLHQRGEETQARELLGMTQKLSEMAAALLVREF